MGIDPKLLGTDEYVVVHLRTHVKKLVVPVLVFVASVALLGVLFALVPSTWWQPWLIWTVVIAYVLVWGDFVVLPYLRWLTSTYTVTNRRIITRTGIITKSGHDLPLRRVNDVHYERDMIDRMFGSGTLVFVTGAENPLLLHDIPDVERVHVQIINILFGDDRADAGDIHED